jgi:hypothetical protein
MARYYSTYAGSALSSFGQIRLGPITMAMLLALILVISEYVENSSRKAHRYL